MLSIAETISMRRQIGPIRAVPATAVRQRVSIAAPASFPESWFCPLPGGLSRYQRRVALGYHRMRKRRVFVVGLARNIQEILPRTMERIETLGSLFADYRVVIYENDSQDNTLDMLSDWSRENRRVTVLSEIRQDPINPPTRCVQRAQRMAYYRNQCHNHIQTHCSGLDNVIVADTDLWGGWSYDGVANTFGHDRWDFVGAYGIIHRREGFRNNVVKHYDAWAFRPYGSYEPLSTASVNAMSWNRGASMLPTFSCFGGLGVYRLDAYLAGKYEGDDCEHVGLHRTMRDKGFGRIFLNPSQITLYGRKHRTLDPFFLTGHRIVNGLARRQKPNWYGI